MDSRGRGVTDLEVEVFQAHSCPRTRIQFGASVRQVILKLDRLTAASITLCWIQARMTLCLVA